MSDLLSRAEAIEAVMAEGRKVYTSEYANAERVIYEADAVEALSMLPSAEAVTHGRLIDADALSEKLCETTIFIKDGELFQRMINDAPTVSAEAVPQLKQTDTLIIADALRYLAQDTERHLTDRTRADALRQQFLKYGASMCKGGDTE